MNLSAPSPINLARLWLGMAVFAALGTVHPAIKTVVRAYPLKSE